MVKRILYIVQAPSGGVARHLIDLIDHLDKNQFTIALICNLKLEDKRFHKWRVASDNILFYDLNTLQRAISPRLDCNAATSIYKIIKKFCPDIVHAHSSKAGLVGRIAAKLAHVKKIIYTPHAYAFMSPEFSVVKRKSFVFAERILSHTCTNITINCSFSENKQALEHRIDVPSKFIVIQNAVPINHDYDRASLKSEHVEKYVVANFARVSAQKNPKLFDKLADEVHRLDDSVVFQWYGANPGNHTADNVNYCGQVERPILKMKNADLFLSTSLFEGLSYSLLEAESIGLPVLASNVPGNDEFIQMCASAHGFDLNAPLKLIGEEIIKLLHSPNKITKTNRDDRFSKMMEKIIGLYQQN